ncbi:MAG: SirB2 family protein [Cytophagales bacterium]|nr:SirB2 family protein [Cytophagales bacterium]MDW8383866.1 SirB2 family protein [Flammeovirgaceae bacterium]
MYKGLLHTHITFVILFLVLYTVKTGLLLAEKKEALHLLRQKTKIPEIIISSIFFLTGIGLLFLIAEIKALLIVKIVLVLISIPIGVVAFKKENKILATLMLAMLILSYGLAEMSKKVEKKEIPELVNLPANAPLEVNVHGKAIYKQYCTICHGEYGDAGMSGAKNLKVSRLSQEEIISLLQDGRGTMPSYAKILSDKEIKVVSEYVISLRK